ncbi:jg21091 [Pararge aegeria aegeria]|uniref:Jg21091 protein n=1 Tax=Pararge aegeria aegeria TaxID=348720 RepID=A0A8S4RYI9_9NEOP|nr:jg21091 [Pararge aegeria aegeria]
MLLGGENKHGGSTYPDQFWVNQLNYQIRFDELQNPKQACFLKGFSTMDHIKMLRPVIQKTEEFNRPLCLAFVDYDKPLDWVETWAVLRSLKSWQIHYRCHNVSPFTEPDYEANCSEYCCYEDVISPKYSPIGCGW